MSEEKEQKNSIPEKKDQKVKVLIRLIISVVAFVALIKYGKVDIGEALSHLLTVNPLYFFLAYVFFTLTICFSGIRFFIASKALGFRKNLWQCVQLNFVGTFFNNFLPTTFGGDALRGYYLKSGTDIPVSRAAGCLLCERYTGMVVLFWMCSLTFLFRDLGFIDESLWNVRHEMAYFTYACTLGSIFVVPFIPKIKSAIFGEESWVYKKFVEPVIIFWNDRKLIGRIFVFSFLLQSCVVMSHYFVAQSLGLEIPLSYYLIFYPLTTIAGFLIPSLNGLGVREGAYIYFLSQIGIGSEEGLAFSVGFLIILLVSSVVGGLVYLFGDFRENMPH